MSCNANQLYKFVSPRYVIYKIDTQFVMLCCCHVAVVLQLVCGDCGVGPVLLCIAFLLFVANLELSYLIVVLFLHAPSKGGR